MRKTLFGSLALLAAATLVVPAALAEPTVNFHAGLDTRGEYVTNFTDAMDATTGATFKDDVEYVWYRARMAMNVEANDTMSAYFEIQNFGAWGDSLFPTNAQDPLVGNIGVTGIAQNNDLQLYQAYFNVENIGGSMISVKGGRQEKTMANELHLGDNDFYSGFYLDGLNVNFGFEKWDLDVFGFVVAERDIAPGLLTSGVTPPILGGSDDTWLFGADAAFDIMEGDTIQPYILLTKQDDESNLIYPSYYHYTLGAVYGRPESRDSAFDWSVEFAMQSGEIKGVCPSGAAECDLSAWIGEGWFGYTFGDEEAAHHRVYLGGLILSEGTSNSDIEAFMPIFPDTHRRAGALDLFSQLSTSVVQGGSINSFYNLTDYYVGWGWSGEKHALGATVHMFEDTEDFGDVDDGEIGNEFDVIWDMTANEYMGVQGGVAWFEPGDDVSMASPDPVYRVWLQGKFRM
jgi:hypothetical protein